MKIPPYDDAATLAARDTVARFVLALVTDWSEGDDAQIIQQPLLDHAMTALAHLRAFDEYVAALREKGGS